MKNPVNRDLMEERNSRTIGAIIVILLVVALAWGIYKFFGNRKVGQDQSDKQPTATVTQVSDEEKFEQELGIDIPDEGQRSTLRDVIGGNRLAIVRRIEKSGNTEIVINANLDDPPKGSFYQAWLVKGDEQIALGELRLTKGGYLLEVTETRNLEGFNRVVITEENTQDNKMEKRVLEGNF